MRRKVTLNYLITRDGAVTLDLMCSGRVVAQVPKARKSTQARTGRSKIAWNGKIGGKRAKAGRYSLVLRATSPDGQTATDTAKLTLRK